MAEELLGVRSAADRLGIGTDAMRKLLQKGRMPARKIDGVWVVTGTDLDEYEGRRMPAHRPWTQQSAWDVLLLASGVRREMPAWRLYEARKRIQAGILGILRELSVRSRREKYVVVPEDLNLVLGHPATVRTGVSGGHLLALGEAEAYLRESDLGAVRSDIVMLTPGVMYGKPNVLLRVVEDANWPFPRGTDVAPDPVVAVDLMDNDDATGRAGEAGRNLLLTGRAAS